ncbi:MAG: cobalamin biosynthesis protein CbiG [Alphaproteobacteria bacterium]|jgi:precorrin-8X/cobalt-precorrin-8 methylmutase|nr:cobalamin biosynthesis protein CbiG [Alphaproteobacteria bacterium]MDP6565109.1 cobalamin biosynthesis protein CbiG [Alphaproteobacteria bacterium]MDP6815961.1 cobalamin biosynthesis protein CbiG [Alphaproteobacteria bacterium]
MAIFDSYLIVDWSANATPKHGRDSIWYCLLERTGDRLRRRRLENPSTRRQAYEEIAKILVRGIGRGRRILAGFDFPNAYPAGFAAAAGFSGRPWRAVWDGLAGLIRDGADNGNNRFAVAAELNRRISGGPFPFWGCPAGRQNRHLSARKGAATVIELAERRQCEAWLPRTQPCWKLYTTGSVGGQALVGIPVLRRLRDHSALAGRIRVWPFETGLQPQRRSDGGGVVLAEVYPSILAVTVAPGQIKDAVQVATVARHLARRDTAGALSADLAGPDELSRAERRLIEREEGWILGAGTFDR